MKVKRKIILFFIELETDSSFFYYLFLIQNKTFLIRNENENKSETKAEVKLI